MSKASLWLLVVPAGLQLWLSVVLLRRSAFRKFPFFCVYTFFSVIVNILMLSMDQNTWTYFYVYWSSEAIYAVLGFMSINEAFREVFWHYYVMWPWFRLVVPGSGCIMLIASVVEGILFPPLQAPQIMGIIIVGDMAVRCLQGGIFCLFILLIILNSLPWQNQSFGIAFGFSISGLGIFLTLLVRSKSGTHFIPVIKFIPPVAYLLAVIVWLFSFIRPEPPNPFDQVEKPTPQQVLAEIRRLSQEVKGLFKRCLAMS